METVEKISSNISNPLSQMADAASDLVKPKQKGIFAQFCVGFDRFFRI